MSTYARIRWRPRNAGKASRRGRKRWCCITDHGRWVDPTAIVTSRGRGIMLMRAVADDLTIDGRDDGTTVCLHFHRCPAAPGVTTGASQLCACGLRLSPAGDCASCG
ncbi:ATP-binding protein [Mycobacterium yunnanensis]|uniref:ATP-binding protein n=1 Tax=Mycobacterium yunnanensis TaxID=368477 RepID=UPI0035590ACA